MNIIYFIAMALLGLVLGSFATALVYRVPRHIQWWSKQRSACTSCGTTLQPRDLVPLFSWLMQKGKCRTCKAVIPSRYPLIELTVLVTTLLTYMVHGLSPETFFIILLLPFLCALLVIDLDELILPDQLVLISGIVGLTRLSYIGWEQGIDTCIPLIAGSILYAAFAWILGLVMTKILKRDALGFGDVKFFAVAGLWLGIALLPYFLIFSGILGVVLALLWQKLKGEAVFPFGPALIISLFLLLLFPGSLFS